MLPYEHVIGDNIDHGAQLFLKNKDQIYTLFEATLEVKITNKLHKC